MTARLALRLGWVFITPLKTGVRRRVLLCSDSVVPRMSREVVEAAVTVTCLFSQLVQRRPLAQKDLPLLHCIVTEVLQEVDVLGTLAGTTK